MHLFRKPVTFALAVAASLLAADAASAATAQFNAPDLDRWMYPFNSSPGVRETAPLFGSAGGTAGQFDDRDGQALAAFNTAALVPAGQGASNYAITSVTLTATHVGTLTFAYDPTYDSVQTYGPSPTVPDSDAGRPIELFGAAFRNGFTQFGFAPPAPPNFLEGSPYAPAGSALLEGARNVFPIDFGGAGGAARDVSNNFRDGFEAQAFSIGQTGLAAGSTVTGGTTFTFALNLANPGVLAFVQAGLDAGTLGFAFTSLFEAQQPGGTGTASYPVLSLRENAGTGAQPITLNVQYALVPEPASALAGAGTLGLLMLRRRRA